MANKIYTGTVGLLLKIDMGDSIAGATAYSLVVKTPLGTDTWTPTLGSDTEFFYLTEAGDLTTAGAYLIQPHFTLGSWTGYGEPVKITIRPIVTA